MGRLIGLTLVLSLTLAAQQRPNLALEDVEDVAGLPRVLLMALCSDKARRGPTSPMRGGTAHRGAA